MALTEEELEHLERLARVRLSGESREKLREQLARIIEFVRQLQTIDTAGFEPRACIGEPKRELRPDVIGPCLPRDEVLVESREHRRGSFIVPPVIEVDEL